MEQEVSIAIDVGGTFIRTILLDINGEIIPDTFSIFPSKSLKGKEIIIENLSNIIKFNITRTLIPEFRVKHIGLAFPGPFDYEKGISYISNVSKYDSIYNLNIKNILLENLFNIPSVSSKLSEDLNILFDNDARLFAIGENTFRTIADKQKKIIYLTIGTGLGSTFMENGQIIEGKYNLPESGWIYNEKFKDGKVDDYISRRGILKIAEELELQLEEQEPKKISELALSGDKKAAKVYEVFGNNLAEMLEKYIYLYSADEIVLGGNISLSYSLFKSGLEEKIGKNKIKVLVIDNTSLNIFKGISKSLGY